MSDISMPERLIVSVKTQPRLPKHIKLRHDEERGHWLILAPERVFIPDETAVTVLRLCDGNTQVGKIATTLASQYQAPEEEILSDIIALLQELSDKGVVTT